jgi:hypothetical protein
MRALRWATILALVWAALPAAAQPAAGARPAIWLEEGALARIRQEARGQSLAWRRFIAWAADPGRRAAEPADAPGLALAALVLEPLRPEQARGLAGLAMDCAARALDEAGDQPVAAGRRLGWAALALDWGRGLMPPERAEILTGRLVAQARAFQNQGRGCFDRASISVLRLTALAGLAARGRHPLAEELVRRAVEERFRHGVLPCLQNAGRGGGWFGGESAGAAAGLELVEFVAAVKTAGGPDLSGSAVWLRHRLAHLCANLLPGLGVWEGRPHLRPAPGGDQVVPPREAADLVRLQMLVLLALRPDDQAAGLARSLLAEGAAGLLEPRRRAYGLIWSRPGGAQAPLATAPLSHLSAGVGRAVSRSDWSGLATWLALDCGPHYALPQHLNAGALLLYRRGFLLDRGGAYDGPDTPHALNYRIRSVAANTLLIRDPGEYSWYDLRQGPRPRGAYANDGGQRAWALFGPGGEPELTAPWTASGWERGPAAWLPNREVYDVARVEVLEDKPRYAYLRGRLTAAYDGSTHKARRVVRHVFHLRGGGPQDFAAAEAVAVVDDVVLARPQATVRAAWHLPARPELPGGLNEAGPGRWSGPVESFSLARGASRLTVRCLAPARARAWVFGPPQAGSWVDGADHPPRGDRANRAPWRVELGAAAAGGPRRTLVHLLLPGPPPGRPPASRALESPDPNLAGRVIQDPRWPRVVAVRLGEPDPQAPVVYRRPAGPSRHLVAGLAPGASYAVQVEPSRVVVSPGPGFTASPAGLLAFVVEPPGDGG